MFLTDNFIRLFFSLSFLFRFFRHSETSSKRQYSDGAGSLQLEFMSSDIQGNYCGGGGVTPGSLEFRRGSAGFELMAGLWRYVE